MAKKNFLLLSMEDTKIKAISNVISNESCRKILDFLADKEASESEVSEKLKLPISTVHYNLQQLMEAGLVSADEFHYSKKGKEISHYKLANKYIIIAPKSTYGIKEKLKGLLPVALISLGAAGILQLVSKYASTTSESPAPMMAAKTAAYDAGAESVMMAAQDSAIQTAAQPFPNIALWFLAGCVFTMAVYLVVSIFRKDKR